LTAGVAALRRGSKNFENAVFDQKMRFPFGHYLTIKEGLQWEKAINAPSGEKYSEALTAKPDRKRKKLKPSRNNSIIG
jgi:hypothetical protein